MTYRETAVFESLRLLCISHVVIHQIKDIGKNSIFVQIRHHIPESALNQQQFCWRYLNTNTIVHYFCLLK